MNKFHFSSSLAGTSLIEVIIAVALMVGSVAFLSLTIPKVAKSSVNSSHRLLADQLATSKIQDLKKNPFEYIRTTPSPGQTGGFPAGIANCDCDDPTLDFSALQSSYTTTTGGTQFFVGWCVNEVTYNASAVPPWTSQCSNPPSSGPYTPSDYKRIHVYVAWPWPPPSNKSGLNAINEESIGTRY